MPETISSIIDSSVSEGESRLVSEPKNLGQTENAPDNEREKTIFIPKISDLPESYRPIVQERVRVLNEEAENLKKLQQFLSGLPELPTGISLDYELTEEEEREAGEILAEYNFLKSLSEGNTSTSSKKPDPRYSLLESVLGKLSNVDRKSQREEEIKAEDERYRERVKSLMERMQKFLGFETLMPLKLDIKECITFDEIVGKINLNRTALHDYYRVLSIVSCKAKRIGMSDIQQGLSIRKYLNSYLSDKYSVCKLGFDPEKKPGSYTNNHPDIIKSWEKEFLSRTEAKVSKAVDRYLVLLSSADSIEELCQLCISELIHSILNLKHVLGGDRNVLLNKINNVILLYSDLNEKEGNSSKLYFHNATCGGETLDRILRSGGIKSHARILADGEGFNFYTGSRDPSSEYYINNEGIRIGPGGTLIPWTSYAENPLNPLLSSVNKTPFYQFSELFVLDSGPYYSSSWCIVLPQRSLAHFQSSKIVRDGIALYHPNYEEGDSNPTFQDGKIVSTNGAFIDFREVPYLIAVEEGYLDLIKTRIYEVLKEQMNIDNDGFERWCEKHLLVIQNQLGYRKASPELTSGAQERFFDSGKFEIPERNLYAVMTGTGHIKFLERE